MTVTVRHQPEPGKKLLLIAIGVVTIAMGLTHRANLRAQSTPQTAASLQFETASVKVAPDQAFFATRPQRSVGRFRWTTQLLYLLAYSYNAEFWRILGDPLGGSIYQIEATTDPNATEDQLRLMVQSLLIERFKMVAHRLTKDVDGYALTLGKNGPKMLEAKEGEVPPLPEWLRRPSEDPAALEGLVVATMPTSGVEAIVGRRVTMLQFTERLQRSLHTAVLDQTGLSGKYYFALRHATGDDPDTLFPNLSNAVKDLGLRLEKHKVPVEMVVVDHIEKIPTAN